MTTTLTATTRGRTTHRRKNGTCSDDALCCAPGTMRKAPPDQLQRYWARVGRTLIAVVLFIIACCVMPVVAQPAKMPESSRVLVSTEGQAFPVPQEWLTDEEARIAHSLRLPDAVPRPVPYDFSQPLWERKWFGAHDKQAVRYWRHLCATCAPPKRASGYLPRSKTSRASTSHGLGRLRQDRPTTGPTSSGWRVRGSSEHSCFKEIRCGIAHGHTGSPAPIA